MYRRIFAWWIWWSPSAGALGKHHISGYCGPESLREQHRIEVFAASAYHLNDPQNRRFFFAED